MLHFFLRNTIDFKMNQEVVIELPKSAHNVTLDSLPLKEPLSLTWKNLEYSVKIGLTKGKKKILKNIHGEVLPGKVTAILGPSGSGKTTLLNLLTGYFQKDVKGEILVNGKPRNVENFRKISSYIMQSMEMVKHLTLYETMMVAADLNFPTSEKKFFKNKFILEILLVLGLTNAKDTTVKNLSGGQFKRLSVAVELLRNPSIIFLDEPTSGLDSNSSLNCIHLLKDLARSGRTIVFTIHQPNSQMFKLIDDLYVISEGNCLYNGPSSELLSFLGNFGLKCPQFYNPADFMIEICHGLHDNVSDNMMQATKSNFMKENKEENEGKVKEEKMETHKYATSTWNQFYVLTKRSFLGDTRNIGYLVTRMMAPIILGILTGWLFSGYGNKGELTAKNTVVIVFQSLIPLFLSALSTLITVPFEIPILRRENANGWYSVKAFYFSRVFLEILLQSIFCSIYATIVYWLTAQINVTWRYLYIVLFSVLLAIATHSYCLIFAVSATFQTRIAMRRR